MYEHLYGPDEMALSLQTFTEDTSKYVYTRIPVELSDDFEGNAGCLYICSNWYTDL